MSLRARILLLVLGAVLLPILAMFWLVLGNRQSVMNDARAQLEERAASFATGLEERIAGSVQLLYGLARVPVVGSSDRAACSDFLAGVLNTYPQYTGLLSILPDGQLHCDSLRSGRKLVLTDRKYFQQALQSSQPVLEPVIGRLTGKGVLQVAYPVRDGGDTLRFILLASLDVDAYMRSIARDLPYGRMHVQIWNHDGSVVMDAPSPGARTLMPGAAIREFVLGHGDARSIRVGGGRDAQLWFRANLPHLQTSGVSLVLSVPESEIDDAVDARFRSTLVGLVLLGIALLVVGILLAEFAIRRQATRLINAIARLDAGDYSPPIGADYPGGEIGQVMKALDRMANSLSQQRQEIERNTAALERQARIDPLTNLANRHMLIDRLEQAIERSSRRARVTGVLMLDLDRFKTVNDSLGHRQGDQLLKEVAFRLADCVRDGVTVARLGGDEFVVVLADMASADDIEIVARKILTALADPVELGLQVLSITTSLGIALHPRDAASAEALLQHADAAMYRAKAQGGNALAFFTREMLDEMVERLQVEAGLRRALEQGELRLHYQPIVDTQTGEVIAAEALVRWLHPERGLIPPAHFIPIAEETGVINPVGRWVMEEACRQACAWRAAGIGALPVAVNLAPRQFSDPALLDHVEHALQASGCPAHLLRLEITESSVMERVDEALETMHRLTAKGVQLYIDDFGTGYSSLSQLKRFPVSTLKIDRAFVSDIGHGESDEILVDTIIAVARKLGLRTVAEGVETAAQLAFLKSAGCDSCQGYFFSPPVDAASFARFVSAHRAALASMV